MFPPLPAPTPIPIDGTQSRNPCNYLYPLPDNRQRDVSHRFMASVLLKDWGKTAKSLLEMSENDQDYCDRESFQKVCHSSVYAPVCLSACLQVSVCSCVLNKNCLACILQAACASSPPYP